jgi:hypothetical protein
MLDQNEGIVLHFDRVRKMGNGRGNPTAYHPERFIFGPEFAYKPVRLQANAVKGTPGPRGYNVALAERSEE